MAHIGALLREHRRKRRFTQRELARRCGLSPGFVALVEIDRRRPEPDSLRDICAALGLSPQEAADLQQAARAAPPRRLPRQQAEPRGGIRPGLLARLRETKGWSQEVLARRVGVSTRTLQRLEAGRPMSSDRLMALAAALGVPPRDLSPKDGPGGAGAGKDEGGGRRSRWDALRHYCGVVRRNAIRALDTRLISLSDLVPGVAFREAWPLGRQFETPLRAYRRPEGVEHVPRKADHGLAKWLLDCMIGPGAPGGPQPISVMMVGDSLSDVELARNLTACEERRLQTISLLLMNGGHPQPVGDFAIDVHGRWSSLVEAGVAAMRKIANVNASGLKYLLLDIDRTIIMPRGLCDGDLESAKGVAVNSLVKRVLGDTQVGLDVKIREAHQLSADFPPYVESNDEDARCLATLLLVGGVIDASHWRGDHCPVRDRDSLDLWLEWSVAQAGRIRPPISNHSFFVEFLREVQQRVRSKVATFLPEYRRGEEEAFLNLSKQGRYSINGHIVRLVSEATILGWIPIGYSDRPGASVGLELYTDYRARPRLMPPALIDIEARCVFEKEDWYAAEGTEPSGQGETR